MLGHRLRALREKRNITQDRVARALDITRPAYTQYESGTRNPDPDMLKKLAELFDVSVDYLLGVNARDDQTDIDPEWLELWGEVKEKGAELEATTLLRSATKLSKAQLRDILKIFDMIAKDED